MAATTGATPRIDQVRLPMRGKQAKRVARMVRMAVGVEVQTAGWWVIM